MQTGRDNSAQWHAGSRTNKSATLRKLAPTAVHLEINPANAARFAITDGTPMPVSSRRATISATAFVTQVVQPCQVFLLRHFAEVNKLTSPSFDFRSPQPSYQACAVAFSSVGR